MLQIPIHFAVLLLLLATPLPDEAEQERLIQNLSTIFSVQSEDRERIMKILFDAGPEGWEAGYRIVKESLARASDPKIRMGLLTLLSSKPTYDAKNILIQNLPKATDYSEIFATIHGLMTQRLTPEEVQALMPLSLTIDRDLYHGRQLGWELLSALSVAGGQPVLMDILNFIERHETELGQVDEKTIIILRSNRSEAALRMLLERLPSIDHRINYLSASIVFSLPVVICALVEKKEEERIRSSIDAVVVGLKNLAKNKESHPEVREVAYLGLAKIYSCTSPRNLEVREFLIANADEWRLTKRELIESFLRKGDARVKPLLTFLRMF